MNILGIARLVKVRNPYFQYFQSIPYSLKANGIINEVVGLNLHDYDYDMILSQF